MSNEQHAAALAYAVELLSLAKPIYDQPPFVVAVLELAAAVREKRDVSDEELGQLVDRALHRPKTRAEWPRARNLCICAVVEGIKREFGLNYTRSKTSAAPSACSVVAEALNQVGHNLSEGAVNKIWSRRPYD